MTTNRLDTNSEPIHVACLIRGKHNYYFVFDKKNHKNVLRVLGRFAYDDELNFTPMDATRLAGEMLLLVNGTKK